MSFIHSLVRGPRVGLVSWIPALDLVVGFPGDGRRTWSSERPSALPQGICSWSLMPGTPPVPPLPEQGPLAGGRRQDAHGWERGVSVTALVHPSEWTGREAPPASSGGPQPLAA